MRQAPGRLSTIATPAVLPSWHTCRSHHKGLRALQNAVDVDAFYRAQHLNVLLGHRSLLIVILALGDFVTVFIA